MIKSNRTIFIIALTVFITLLIAYSNHFHNGFHFDDSHTVQDNVYIRNLKNIPAFFTDPKMFSANPLHQGLRPLVSITLAIDYWLAGGLNPFYFQLSTFIWYTLMCILLFFLYKNIFKSSISHKWVNYLALFSAAWYALHTANAETVNYVIARSDVLSTFCIIASLLIYISLPAYQKWYLYVIPALIGVLAKETVLVLVIILFFYIILFEKKISLPDIFKAGHFKHILSAVTKLLPLLISVIAVQLYLLSGNSHTTSNAVSNAPVYYILTQAYVWLHYFIAFFLPMNLSADSDWTVINNVFDERIIIGLVFVIGLVITIFKTSAKAETKPISFGLIWFSASLLPTSLIPLAEVTNDHRMFFAFIGLSLSVVSYIGNWLAKNEQLIRQYTQYRILIGLSACMVLSLNAYGVYQRNKVWKDEESLWLDVTIKSPMNGRGLMNYGLTQMQKGNYTVAADYFNKALTYLPYYNTLYINLGVLNGAMNKNEDAEENFKKAITYSPNTDDSYIYYARYLREKNQLPEAKTMAEKAFQINQSSLMTLNLLMDIYNNLALWDKLAQIANQTLALLPNNPTAVAYLAAAKKHTPVLIVNNQPASSKQLTAADYLNLSLSYYNAKDYNKCIEACQQALKLKPDYADAYSNIGAAYNMLQQWDKGYDACVKALKIDPHHKLAMGNLNWAKSQMTKSN